MHGAVQYKHKGNVLLVYFQLAGVLYTRSMLQIFETLNRRKESPNEPKWPRWRCSMLPENLLVLLVVVDVVVPEEGL
jgi:hypothetical protein